MGMVVIQPYISVSKLKKITLYWLPKLHKKNYKARCIANSSSCTTTELSKLLMYLTAVKKRVIKYCENVFERSGKENYFGLLKIQVKF